MKRFAWIIGLIFCTICTIQAKDRVIERPPFLAWSSNSIEIDKIVMSDTVTTVYIKAFYRPKYWIKIATGSFLKDNNGMLYPIRKGVGITLDKEANQIRGEEKIISTPDSKVTVAVIPTNEELAIAHETVALLK